MHGQAGGTRSVNESKTGVAARYVGAHYLLADAALAASASMRASRRSIRSAKWSRWTFLFCGRGGEQGEGQGGRSDKWGVRKRKRRGASQTRRGTACGATNLAAVEAAVDCGRHGADAGDADGDDDQRRQGLKPCHFGSGKSLGTGKDAGPRGQARARAYSPRDSARRVGDCARIATPARMRWLRWLSIVDRTILH